MPAESATFKMKFYNKIIFVDVTKLSSLKLFDICVVGFILGSADEYIN